MSPYLKDVDDFDLRSNHFQPEGDDMHHVTDSNMDGVVSNAYGALDGPMTRAWVKRLQSILTSHISAIEDSMSLKAYEVNENGSICLFAFNCSFGRDFW